MSEMKNSHSNCANCGVRDESLLCSSPNIQEAVEKARVTCRFKPGQTIFYAGNDPLGIFTIQSGLVKLEVTSPSGSAHTVRLVGAGGTLGYRSLFSNEPYHASAVAWKIVNSAFFLKRT